MFRAGNSAKQLEMIDKITPIAELQCCGVPAVKYKNIFVGESTDAKLLQWRLEDTMNYELIRSMMHNIRVCPRCHTINMQCNMCDRNKWANRKQIYFEIEIHLNCYHFIEWGSIAPSNFIHIDVSDLFRLHPDVAEQFARTMLINGQGAVILAGSITIYANSLLRAFPQLIFVNVNNVEGIRLGMLSILCENRSTSIIRGGYVFNIEEADVDQIANLISRGEFTCLMCGAEFDSSPPSVEMVAGHYRECTSLHCSILDTSVNAGSDASMPVLEKA